MLPDEAVEALSPREKTIITHRFGPPKPGEEKPGEEETLEQIGQELGVSRERIRQLPERAMTRGWRRLREFL